MKLLMVIGLSFAVVGTTITGYFAQGGIPKPGDLIKAPKKKLSIIGWTFILIGFVCQLIATIIG